MKLIPALLLLLSGIASAGQSAEDSFIAIPRLAETLFSSRPDKKAIEVDLNRIWFRTVDCPVSFCIFTYPNRYMAEFEYGIRENSPISQHTHPPRKIGDKCFQAVNIYDKKASIERLTVLTGNSVILFEGSMITYETMEPFAKAVIEQVKKQSTVLIKLAQGELYSKWEVPDGVQFEIPFESLDPKQVWAVRNDWIRLRYLIVGINALDLAFRRMKSAVRRLSACSR